MSLYREEIFNLFADEILFWSRSKNIVGYRTKEEILLKGVYDSIKIGEKIYEVLMAEGFELLVADIGTGAGFPSIPMKVMYPDLEIYAFERSSKKLSFLRYFTTKYKIQIKIFESVDEVDVKFSAVVSRGVAEKEFIPIAKKIKKDEGFIVLTVKPENLKNVKYSFQYEIPKFGKREIYFLL